MGHTFSNILYHIIFTTQGRRNLIPQAVRNKLYSYIIGISKRENCKIVKIGGTENHVHILAILKPSIAPSDFVRKIKANSTKWVHENFARLDLFSWQAGFACFSVSQSAMDDVVKYIDNQLEHHHRIPFRKELKIFLEKHGIKYDPNHYLD